MRIPALLWLLSAALVGLAGEDPQAASLADADKTIDDLRRLPAELAAANSRLRAHVEEAMTRFDRGGRAAGKSWQGADTGLNQGEAQVMQTAIYKLFLARAIATRGEDYHPAVLADCDRLQELIGAAQQKIEDGDALARRMLLVPARDLSASANAAWRAKTGQLRKARAAAEESVKRSLLMLPLDLTEVDSTDSRNSAWEMLQNGVKPPRDPRVDPDARDAPDSPQRAVKPVSVLPIHLVRNRRITLVNEPGYRIALTDPAIEDRSGRRIFYEEEWEQRGSVVVRMRWRVGVDSKTGQHLTIKRYRLIERRGSLDDLYGRWDPDYLWYLEPAEDSVEPSRGDIGAPLARAAAARQEIRDAIDRYMLAIHQAVEHNDESRAQANQAAIDGALSARLREKLFAIRGHLAHVESILALEKDVRGAVDHSSEAVSVLESLAAWGNVASDQDAAGGMAAAEWDNLQESVAAEIDAIHTARLQARAALPPEVLEHQATFAALQKGLVVHIFRPFSARPTEPLVRYIQEIWGWQLSPVGGSPEVRRAVALIQIDSRTGDQIRIGDAMKYYTAGADATLEDIFERYGGQDLPIVASR